MYDKINGLRLRIARLERQADLRPFGGMKAARSNMRPKEIVKHLFSDMYEYGENIEEMTEIALADKRVQEELLIDYLKKNKSAREEWSRWFSGEDMNKRADLSPGLGSKDPCFILERAVNNGANIPKVRYVKEVLEDLDVVTHQESGRKGLKDIPKRDRNDWYRLTYPRRLKERVEGEEITYGKGGRKKLPVNIPHLTYSQHAQFRMDLRGVTVEQVEAVVKHWHTQQKKVVEGIRDYDRLKEIAMTNKEEHDSIRDNLDWLENQLRPDEIKKMKDDMRRLNREMEINHEYMGVFVGFVPQRDGSIDIKTVFDLKKEDKPYSSYNC